MTRTFAHSDDGGGKLGYRGDACLSWTPRDIGLELIEALWIWGHVRCTTFVALGSVWFML